MIEKYSLPFIVLIVDFIIVNITQNMQFYYIKILLEMNLPHIYGSRGFLLGPFTSIIVVGVYPKP